SGSKILDESAIRTLKGMERFYPVPEEIRELEITVPIAYRLIED
ncbi:MAG: energy transducer TonB, partial [Nitrospirae bacterium]|nr:energy transducer TonB [Nitrospirota bacterium]